MIPIEYIVAEVESGSSLAHLDLSQRVIPADTDLNKARMSFCNFGNSTLNQATFDGAQLRGASFSGCSAIATSFRGAQLHQSVFVKSDLTKANFENACLISADFTGANLQDALLLGADLTNAIMPDGRTYEDWIENPLKSFNLSTSELENILTYWDREHLVNPKYISGTNFHIFDALRKGNHLEIWFKSNNHIKNNESQLNYWNSRIGDYGGWMIDGFLYNAKNGREILWVAFGKNITIPVWKGTLEQWKTKLSNLDIDLEIKELISKIEYTSCQSYKFSISDPLAKAIDITILYYLKTQEIKYLTLWSELRSCQNHQAEAEERRHILKIREGFGAYDSIEAKKLTDATLDLNLIWDIKERKEVCFPLSGFYPVLGEALHGREISSEFFKSASVKSFHHIERIIAWAEKKPELFYDLIHQLLLFHQGKNIHTKDYPELNKAILTLVVPVINTRSEQIKEQAESKGVDWARAEFLSLYEQALEYELEEEMIEKILALVYEVLDGFKESKLLARVNQMIFRLSTKLDPEHPSQPTIHKISDRLDDLFVEGLTQTIIAAVSEEQERIVKDSVLPHNILFDGSNLKEQFLQEIAFDKSANEYVEHITELAILENFADTEAQSCPEDTIEYYNQLKDIVKEQLEIKKESEGFKHLLKHIDTEIQKCKFLSFFYENRKYDKDNELEVKFNLLLDILMDDKNIPSISLEAIRKVAKRHLSNPKLAHISQKLLDRLPPELQIEEPSTVSKVAIRVAAGQVSNLVQKKLYPNAGPVIQNLIDLAAGTVLAQSDNKTVKQIAKELRVSATAEIFNELIDHVKKEINQVELPELRIEIKEKSTEKADLEEKLPVEFTVTGSQHQIG